MTKSTKKKAKSVMSVKKSGKGKKTTKGQTKADEYLDCLLELHKLQGELLTRLAKEI